MGLSMGSSTSGHAKYGSKYSIYTLEYGIGHVWFVHALMCCVDGCSAGSTLLLIIFTVLHG